MKNRWMMGRMSALALGLTLALATGLLPSAVHAADPLVRIPNPADEPTPPNYFKLTFEVEAGAHFEAGSQAVYFVQQDRTMKEVQEAQPAVVVPKVIAENKKKFVGWVEDNVFYQPDLSDYVNGGGESYAFTDNVKLKAHVIPPLPQDQFRVSEKEMVTALPGGTQGMKISYPNRQNAPITLEASLQGGDWIVNHGGERLDNQLVDEELHIHLKEAQAPMKNALVTVLYHGDNLPLAYAEAMDTRVDPQQPADPAPHQPGQNGQSEFPNHPNHLQEFSALKTMKDSVPNTGAAVRSH